MTSLQDIFLSPSGRLSRRDFWIGFAGLCVFNLVINLYLRTYPEWELSFWVALVFPFLLLHMIYCVYGKRLHDMGRSFWPLTGAITLEIFVIIGLMLAFGGAEYFSEFAQYDRKAVIDEAVRKELITAYQDKISNNLTVIRPLMLVVPLVFTLWVGLTKRDENTNTYGAPA